TESFGASYFGSAAQPPSSGRQMIATRASRRGRLSRMREHVLRDQHDALVRDQETLGVFGAIEADARSARDLATCVDDGVAHLAVLADAHVGQDYRPFDDRTLLDPNP